MSDRACRHGRRSEPNSRPLDLARSAKTSLAARSSPSANASAPWRSPGPPPGSRRGACASASSRYGRAASTSPTYASARLALREAEHDVLSLAGRLHPLSNSGRAASASSTLPSDHQAARRTRRSSAGRRRPAPCPRRRAPRAPRGVPGSDQHRRLQPLRHRPPGVVEHGGIDHRQLSEHGGVVTRHVGGNSPAQRGQGPGEGRPASASSAIRGLSRPAGPCPGATTPPGRAAPAH